VHRIAEALPEGHAQPLGHDLDAMARWSAPEPRLVFIANPNNPTGTWLDCGRAGALHREPAGRVIVVVDEAYFEYVSEPGYPDASRWLERFPNLVVTRTFSKAYGLAGLRIGYALSSPEIADVLNRVRQPFNANSLAQAAALGGPGDTAHLRAASS
jgi:histidinol-phosphate aminotransferase